MPKPGFKSYSIREDLYNSLQKKFEQEKSSLRKKGVTSFSAFLTYLMNQKFESTLLKDHNPMLEKVKIVSNTIILKDNIKNRVVELKIKKGKIFCEFDKKTDCIHVGFVYSLPEIYEILEKKKV